MLYRPFASQLARDQAAKVAEEKKEETPASSSQIRELIESAESIEGTSRKNTGCIMLRRKEPSISIPLHPLYPPYFTAFNILVNVGVVLTYPILISIGTVLSVPGNAGTGTI